MSIHLVLNQLRLGEKNFVVTVVTNKPCHHLWMETSLLFVNVKYVTFKSISSHSPLAIWTFNKSTFHLFWGVLCFLVMSLDVLSEVTFVCELLAAEFTDKALLSVRIHDFHEFL